jgi:hypothetical protein
MRKARSDSQLKVLPEARQAEIIAHMRAHSLAETAAYCRQTWNLTTSQTALSEFFSWWHVTRSLVEAKSFTDRLKADLKTIPGLDLDDDKISRLGQRVFELEALKNKDASMFMGLRRLRQSEVAYSLERDKFQFDAAKACLKALPELRAIAADSALDENGKLNAVRARLFGDLPE